LVVFKHDLLDLDTLDNTLNKTTLFHVNNFWSWNYDTNLLFTRYSMLSKVSPAGGDRSIEEKQFLARVWKSRVLSKVIVFS
jgi:hypothetical protein